MDITAGLPDGFCNGPSNAWPTVQHRCIPWCATDSSISVSNVYSPTPACSSSEMLITATQIASWAAGAIIAYNAGLSSVGGIFNCWIGLFAPGALRIKIVNSLVSTRQKEKFLRVDGAHLQHNFIILLYLSLFLAYKTALACAGIILIYGVIPW